MEAPAEGQRPVGWWANRSIRTKGLVVLSVPIAILLVVLASTSWFTHVNNRAQTLGGQARLGVTETGTLSGTLLDADDAVRGYLLTGDPTLLGPYDSAKTSTPELLDQVGRLASMDAAEHRAYLALSTAGHRLMIDVEELAGLPPPASSAATQALIRTTAEDGDKFGRAVSDLEQTFDSNLLSQHHTIHISNIYLLVITIAAAALALAGGIVVTQMFTTGVTRRLRRLERATDVLEQGGIPQDVPGGRDEIGRLSERLMRAGAELRDRAEERDGARRQLEDILTASPVVSLRYDVESRTFSYASPNLERLLGLPSEQAMSNPSDVIERFHPDDAAHLRDLLVDASARHARAASDDNATRTSFLSTSERVAIMLRFRRDPSADEWGEAEAVYTLEYDPDDRLVAAVAYLVDTSERHAAQRAAEERRSMLETIFHASPDTIVVRDISGQIILASSNLADVIGVGQRSIDRSGEFADASSRIASVTPEDRELLDSLASRCLAGEPTPDPVLTTSRFSGGELRTFETRARAVIDHVGHVAGTVTVSRDITDRMRLEQSLREASAETARASQAKSEFLSRMSHELRTPLNAILGFAQLLELDELSEDQSSSVDQIQTAGRHLLSLINEVLDIARIEAGRFSLSAEPVPVGAVLREVATLLAPAAESADLELTVSAEGSELYVRADRQRLLQVLLNLGSNALKYNQRGGSVSFRAIGLSRSVRFEVRDTGPGIPREQQDRLFVPFSRLGAESSGVEGTGVGLALSKQLVELMGGSIGVDSLPAHGSTFWVELLAADSPSAPRPKTSRVDDVAREELEDSPRARSPLPVPAAPAKVPAQMVPAQAATRGEELPSPVPGSVNGDSGADELSRSSDRAPASPEVRRDVVVLQIEDNASNASLVEQVLARRGAVHLVTSPEAGLGLALAREHRPDLILLDLHLPDMPGEELLYRLKAVPELKDTKVVVVSADATPSRIRRMLELGVEGYLTKPVDVEALLRLVDLELAGTRSAS